MMNAAETSQNSELFYRTTLRTYIFQEAQILMLFWATFRKKKKKNKVKSVVTDNQAVSVVFLLNFQTG